MMAVAGFAPTYYLRLLSGGPTATISGGPFTGLVHVHAALFSAWVVLFIVSDRARFHPTGGGSPPYGSGTAAPEIQ